MTIFIIKNGKIKISSFWCFFYLSALFTYLFKLSWNHQLKYCTRLCKIHFMFHLCCWFSSALTDKPMIMSTKVSSNLARLYKSLIKCETRLLCIFFYFFWQRMLHCISWETIFVSQKETIEKPYLFKNLVLEELICTGSEIL